MLWDRARACCFSGHRPDKLPCGYNLDSPAAQPLKAALQAEIDRAVADGFDTFLCGMAQGVDTLAAQLILAMRERGMPLQLVAALPYPHQDARWPAAQRKTYRQLLAQIPPALQFTVCDSYTPYCMNGRNLWMVEHASRLIAVFDGSAGGTANTVRHAQDAHIDIICIHPKTLERW